MRARELNNLPKATYTPNKQQNQELAPSGGAPEGVYVVLAGLLHLPLAEGATEAWVEVEVLGRQGAECQRALRGQGGR